MSNLKSKKISPTRPPHGLSENAIKKISYLDFLTHNSDFPTKTWIFGLIFSDLDFRTKTWIFGPKLGFSDLKLGFSDSDYLTHFSDFRTKSLDFLIRNKIFYLAFHNTSNSSQLIVEVVLVNEIV